MESTTEEIAAPMGELAWKDDALLDAFERAVASHGLDKKTERSNGSQKKPKMVTIFKNDMRQEEQSDDNDGYSELITPNPSNSVVEDNMAVQNPPEKPSGKKTSKTKEASAATKTKKEAPQQASTNQPQQPPTFPNAPQSTAFPYAAQPTAAAGSFPYAPQAGYAQYYPAEGYPSADLSLIPDLEEQEYLSQLLLAWYQAGYAAGRYMQYRQQKKFLVC